MRTASRGGAAHLTATPSARPAIWTYWRRVLVTSCAQCVEWLRWGSWPQFIPRAGGAIFIALAIGWLCGPLAAMTMTGRAISAIAAAAIMALPVYLAAIVVTAARLDHGKESRIAAFDASLARHRERKDIGGRLQMIWNSGDRLRKEFTKPPHSRQMLKLGAALAPRRGWRADVDSWFAKVEREAARLQEGEAFGLASRVNASATAEAIQDRFAALEATLSNLRFAADRFLEPMD